MKKKIMWRTGTLFVGAIVFAFCLRYILVNFHWSEVLRIVNKASLVWLIGAGSASIIAYWFVRAARWYIILKNLGIHVGFMELYVCGAASLGIATITPLHAGEMLKVELLKRRGEMARSAGYGSFAVERALDLLAIVSAATACVLCGIGFGVSRQTAVLLWGLSASLLLAGVLIVRKARIGGRFGELIRSIRKCLAGRTTFPVVMALTLAAWALVALGWQFSLYSIGIDVGFLKSLTLMAVVALAAILSFVPGGLGVSEVGTTQVLMRFGQPATMAQAGAVIMRSYAILIVLLGLIHLAVYAALKAKLPVPSVPGSENG